jgi:formylglycine-generating enzyme required for sulfatase activity/tetratricopeptide (TPR) repeat protein
MKWKEFQDDEKKDDEKSIQARREKDYLWRRNEVKKEYDRFLPDLRDALIADYEEAGGDRDKFVADVHARFSEVTWFLSPPSFDSKEQKESIEKIIKEFLMDFSAKDAGGISSEIHKFMGGSAVNLDSIYELFSDKRGYRGIPRHFVHAIKSVIPLFVDACDVHGIARNNETLPMQPTLGNMLRIAFGCFAQIKNKETTYIQWSDTSEIFSGWLGSSERDGEISFVVFNDSFRNKGDVSPEWAKVFDTMISFYLRSKKYTEETVQHGTTTSQSVPPVGGKSVKERFELALEMANSGMFDKAEIEYTTCMQDTSMNPDDIQLKVKACLNLGKIYVRQGRFDDARTCYTKGMAMGKKEQFPVEKAQILNALGKSYIEEMKPENRSTMCDAAIRSYNECVKFVVDTKSTDTEVLSEKARAENYIDEANACKDACKDLPKEIADVFSPTGIEGFEFRPIPSGEFTMGSPKGEKGRDTDEQQHKVIITKPFWLGRTPVTQGQWKAVMGTSLQEQFDMAWNSSAKCWPGKDNKVSSLITMKEWFKNRGLENYEDVKRRFLGNVGENYPMNWVSYDNAVAFCKKLTEQERADGRLPEGYAYALPTEAQWEYACRAGGSGAYGRMEDGKEGDLDKMGWYREDSNSTTHPVAQKKPNAWGLYDMHGNVWEWCADWYDNYRTGSVTDPSGPRSGVARVRRGGGWDYPAAYCRSAYRDRNVPAYRSGNLGFRLALRPVLGDD